VNPGTASSNPCAQVPNLVADMTGESGEALLALLLGRRGERLHIGADGGLGVHNDAAPAGKPHHKVGPERSVFRSGGTLLGEIAVFQHPGHLHHVAELNLPPAAAYLRRRSASASLPVSNRSLSCSARRDFTCSVRTP